MTGQNTSKGNGAAKRMNNPRLKERRAASWKRGEKRHEVNRKRNEAKHAEYVALVKRFGLELPMYSWTDADGKVRTKRTAASTAVHRYLKEHPEVEL